jgi:chaperone modulatory protein CbpM
MSQIPIVRPDPSVPTAAGQAPEADFAITLVGLSRACRIDSDQLLDWVAEGVITPIDGGSEPWRFAGSSLQRARTASRLAHDLALDAAALALVLTLLDRIAALDARLLRLGAA